MNLRFLHAPISIAASLFVLLFVAACGTAPPAPDAALSPEQLAERAYARGEYGKAAEYWQKASESASAQGLDSLRLRTADAWLRSQRTDRASALLNQVDQQALTRQDLALFNIARADLALQQDDPEMAGIYLQAVTTRLPSELRRRFLDLQQQQSRMQRDPSDRSLREVAELSAGMVSYDPTLALEIIRSLEAVPSGQLNNLIEQQLYDPEFTEWLELALMIRTLVVSDLPVNSAAQTWEDYHYAHVVDQSNFKQLLANYRALFPVPATVAVLLPAEGGLSAVSKAIRDGILSAYLEQPGAAELRFYSSGETSESAIMALQQALDDGATQIVGPLRVESTRALGGLQDLTTPMLLLNELPSGIPAGDGRSDRVNSLLLSQTEEAEAIARRAIAQGQKRAIVMMPGDAWGQRMVDAFSNTFEQYQGQIIASSRFGITGMDYSTMLKQLLKIDESRQRKTDLQSWLGVSLNFEPSRREDFDIIFMAARPAAGRELKPLLRFHDAGDIPVYAMSRIYSGRTEPASDQDLDGVIFPTTRWQLRASGKAYKLPASVRDGAFGNFYALGQDTWRLLPWLPLMRKDPDLWFSGEVGALRLMQDGRIQREPAWAQFSAGLPEPYQWPDSL